MVESNPRTQLPSAQIPQSEELKEDLQFMVGTADDMLADIKKRLDGIELNQLEEGLLNRYVANRDGNFAKQMAELFQRIENKQENSYWQNKVRKVKQLFIAHEFWSTQPVPNYYEQYPLSAYDQPVDQIKTVDMVQQEPLPLPEGYSWAVVDLMDDDQANKVYNLLTNHYVEDTEGKFRFDYSIQFLRWALCPPGYDQNWIIGVMGNKNLVGFISAIPVHMAVNQNEIKMAEVNFLCVHKRIRDKRLAPTLIKEITRRVNLTNQWQAIYTSGTILPTPFAVAQYYHRNLNPQKLVECQFAFRPSGEDQAKFNKKHKLPQNTVTQGLRPMVEQDIPKVAIAINEHLSQNYKVHIKFSEEEVAHFLLTKPDVVYSWLVEDPQTGKVTDFISFYALNSSVLNHDHHKTIFAAYAYYNFVKDNDPDRMKQLIKDNLILAKQNKYDVFNMTTVLQHELVKEELLFKPGDGRLSHYLYNWRIQCIKNSDIGIVLV